MATGARWGPPVPFETFPDRTWVLRLVLFRKSGHDVGWWRRWSTEDVLQNELATQHRRGAVRMRRHHQDGALAEQSPAGIVLERDAAEVAAVPPVDAVVARQPLIDERVVRGHQVEDAAVFAHDRPEEEVHFGEQRLAQVVVEVGELV